MSHSHIHSYSFIFYLLNWMLGHLAMRSEPNPVGPTLARRTPSYTSPYLSLCPARDNHLISFHGPFLDFTSLFIFFSFFFMISIDVNFFNFNWFPDPKRSKLPRPSTSLPWNRQTVRSDSAIRQDDHSDFPGWSEVPEVPGVPTA